MYTVVTLCVSIQELTTKHLTLFWVGPVKCHIISLYTPLQPIFSLALLQGVKHCLHNNTDGNTGKWCMGMEDPGTT